MTIDISEYRLTYKRMTGRNVKLFFKRSNEDKPTKVLELINVAAFIDHYSGQNLFALNIVDEAGSYGADIAMQTKKPEVESYKEVFIFSYKTNMNSVFRSLSENVVWRDFDDSLYRDLNY